MKHRFVLLMTAFLLLTGRTLWGQSQTEVSIDFSAQGYENAQEMDGVVIDIDENVTVVFNIGTGNNGPKYYNMGSSIRAYAGNNFVVSSTGTISSIMLTFGSGDGSNEILTEVGSFESAVWTGNNSEVIFTIGGSSGHRRIKEIAVIYSSGGVPQQYVDTPTFSPEAGVFYEPQSVTISCATEGATIRYTLDGTVPSEESPIFSTAITIEETTTVKAKAWKAGYQPSPVASATYSITNMITIAEARALEDNEYAMVQGVVTLIDNRNIYIQDVTAGIDLFLNSNTTPSSLALGDMVRAYGKKTIYNGLVELTNINGNDSEVFSILSSGNALPLATKTIAEILAGAADELQSTRVKIESATLGETEGNNTPLTQDGNEIVIYKMPVLSGIEAGDLVDLIGVVGYFNAPQMRVANASDVVLAGTPVQPDPQLNASVTSLSGFNYTVGSGPSQTKNFNISGSNLITNVYFTAPESFELSFNTDNGYFDVEELSPVNGTLTDTIVYVRMKAGLNPGSYSGNLSIVSGDLNMSIALDGIVDELLTTMTIADARALENGESALVEGVVVFIDGRNVYIQDETAGIDLYLNNNTVPSELAIGDEVRAYGSKSIYKGLVELSDINGSDANAFSILSSGNELPLTHQTIESINTDFNGENMLQSTRVKIVDAIIGTINPNSTTVISQGDNTLNIYQIPTVEGLMEGDMITVTGIVSCYNTPQLRVANIEDIEFSPHPHLTVTPSTLTGFTYIHENGGPSEIQYFEINGENLTSNVNVIPSENFEISSYSGESFQAEAIAVIDIPDAVYVRLKAGLEVGTYNEQIIVVCEDIDTLFVNVSGIVTEDTPTPPTPTDDNYVRISNLSQLIAGSQVVFAARFNETTSDYYAMSNTSSGKPTGVLFTSTTNEDNEILPASIVNEESSYYWIVGMTDNGYTFTNAAGQMIGWLNSTNFTPDENTEWSIAIETAGENAMVPNYTGFTVTNVNTTRGFALNSQYNFGPYATSNNNNSGYNFYLDLFVKAGGEPPVPPTPTVATPTFAPTAGTYYEAQEVTISCATEGATIYYSTISENGPWTSFSEAITVNESMTIWAYATKEGYYESDIAMANYIIQLGMVTIFNQDWEGEMNEWSFVDVEGPASWTISSYQGNHFASANGYNQGTNEDWCISPAFNLNAYSNPVLSFRTAKNYTGPDLEVFFSNNYDGENPDAAEWTPLICNLSTGGWIWTESGNIDLSGFSGINCYIGFKYTSEEGSAAGWEVDDILLVGQTSAPIVTITPLALTGFTYIEGYGPSAEQSFTISGFNLGNNVMVTIDATSNFEISSVSDSGFSTQSIPLSPIGSNIEDTPIYVRLKADLAVGDYENDITIVCDDVDNINVTCHGTVTAQPIPASDYIRIGDVSQLVAGNQVIFAARYDETANAYLAVANTLTSGKLSTTDFTSQMNGTNEIIPASILIDEENYYWTVDITPDGYTFTNAYGDIIGYGTSGTSFEMNSEKTTWNIENGVSDPISLVPEYQGFIIKNTTTTNRGMALRVTDANSVIGAYSTNNLTNLEYNFYLDIFMQGEGGPCTVAAPTFDPAGGTYYDTLDVTLSCTTDGATIWYSPISGNGPWTPYLEPITVDGSIITIWAYASKEGCNDSPVVSADYLIQNDLVIIFNQDWENGWNGWTEYCEMGDSLWRIASYQGNHYAYANGYNHPASVDWLISPAFDLDSYSDVVLTFVTAKNYTGPDLEVFFSNDYDGQDPTTAIWQPLECELSQGSWNWIESGEISLDGFSGSNCYIGFRYTSDEDAAGWEVDDIMLISGGNNTDPYLIATPNALSGLTHIVGLGPSEAMTFTLSGGNFLPLPGGGYGGIYLNLGDLIYNGFEMSLDGEEYTSSTLYIELDETLTLEPTTIYVRLWGEEIGPYSGSILIEEPSGVSITVALSGTVHSGDEPIAWDDLPRYIQGNNGSNNNRVPVATYVWFQNLEPNTTYRYTNQFVDDNDGPETAGAGNVIYANLDGFYRSTSPSLATEGGYGEFTTHGDGEANVWFVNEPTANARFTPGNHVYLRIRLNDGHDGTSVEHIFTTENYATVLNFGNEHNANQGTAFYVKSNENPMTFAKLFTGYNDPQNPDSRPIYSTIVETTGVDFGNINQYADFYKEEVAGKDGWFGGILPNDNEYGINKILVFDITHYWFQDYYTAEFDGQWAPEAFTINPDGGLDEPIFIDLTDDGVEEQEVETNVKVWSADHEIVIENGDDSHYTMTVYNILGQPMMQKQINSGNIERIGHNLASGMYIINLQNNQNKVALKLMVR